MRSLISLLIVALLALGIYAYFLKRGTAPGTVATQIISTTGVEMDLNAIAQAERSYFAQNGNYASLDQLTSSGDLTLTRPGRDGYAYAVEASASGFTAVARHEPAPSVGDAAAPHYPVISIDQTMQIEQSK